MAVVDSFSTRLKKLREVAGLTQTQLAEKLGVSRGSISYYENRERVPDIEFLDKVTVYFGVSLNFMMGYTEIKVADNEDIGLRLDLTEKAIERLSDDSDHKFHVSGETLSRLLENDKFSTFIRTFEEYLLLTADLKSNQLRSFEREYVEFLLSKVFIHIADEIRKQGLRDSINSLPKDEYNSIIEGFHSDCDRFVSEWATLQAELSAALDASESKEDLEDGRVRNLVQDYLRDIDEDY